MNHLQDLSELIYSRVKADQMDAHQIQMLIAFAWGDATKILKNINETSLSESDRVKRIIELEEKSGLPKTHLL